MNKTHGKIIVIEGLDGSGKGTQVKNLIQKLNNDNIKVKTLHFPNYDSPTGKIVGGPYLGHEEISNRYFKELSSEIDGKIPALYYAADFKYNMDRLMDDINDGVNIILDRYVESTMAYQGGIISNKDERLKMYNWIYELNYKLLNIPKPDLVIYLKMDLEVSNELRKTRNEKLDAHESNIDHLMCAENAYNEMAKLYDFKTINCTKDTNIRSVEEINNELYNIVRSLL